MNVTLTRRFVLLAASLGVALAAAQWLGPAESSLPGPDRPAVALRATDATPEPALKLSWHLGELRPQELPQQESAAASMDLANLIMSSAFAAPTSPPPSRTTPARSAPRGEGDQLVALDTELIGKRVSAEPPEADAFETRTWTAPPPPPPPAPPPPPPAPPPPPQAPPLPFKYLGKLEESAERAVWYFRDDERLIVVAAGETIDSTYRFEGLESGQLRFTYLPLEIRQSLPLGGAP